MTSSKCTTVVIIPLGTAKGRTFDPSKLLNKGPHCLDEEAAPHEVETFHSKECGIVEKGRRSDEWVMQTGELLHSLDSRWHEHVTPGPASSLIGPWQCTGVEYLRMPQGFQEERGEVGAFALLHTTAETSDPAEDNLALVKAVGKAVTLLSRDESPHPADGAASLPPSLREILKVHHHRPEDRLKSVAEVGWSPEHSADAHNLLEQLTVIATQSRDFPVADPDDRYTQLPARLSPSPSWKLVAARSGVAMGIARVEDAGEKFGKYLPALARSIYADVMVLTLIQARAASSLATDAADMYRTSLDTPRLRPASPGTTVGHPTKRKHSKQSLDERIVDLRVGAHRMQPWARGGTFADVHRALQDQYRIPARVAEAEDLTTRVSAAIEARATKRATRTVEFLSALILLPTAIATFSALWLDHHSTDGTTGFVVTTVVSLIAAVTMFAWMYRGWIQPLRRATASRLHIRRPSPTSASVPDIPSSES